MKKNILKPTVTGFWIFFLVAIIMLIYEYIKETLFQGLLTAWQSHTITIFFTSFLASLIFVIFNSWIMDILAKKTEIKIKEEKLQSMKMICQAIFHIINNFLNHFQLIKTDINSSQEIRAETLRLLDKSIAEVKHQLSILEKIKDPTDKESYDEIFPQGAFRG